MAAESVPESRHSRSATLLINTPSRAAPPTIAKPIAYPRNVRLNDLVVTSERLAATRARNEKVAELADLLRRLEPGEVGIGVAWLAGRLRQGRIGLGWSAIDAASRAPAEDSAPPSLFDALPAAPAERSPLALSEVDAAFTRMAESSGAGTGAVRARELRQLFARANDVERDFLVRLIHGELRQGALEGVMVEAVALAAGTPPGDVRRALMLSGDLEATATAALAAGSAGLARFRLTLFQPLQPMLAQPAVDLDDALRRLGTAALEYKLDGARIQVHREGDDVRVYSRQLNEVTARVPEVVEVARALPVRDAILDGEAIALRPDGRPHPFQVTMRRFGRSLEVERVRADLPLTTVLFDALRLDGRDLIDAPAHERVALLAAIAPRLVVPRRVTSDPAEAGAFLEEALERGHEGVMAKALDAPYEAGGRGFAWLKVKGAHTLDLVVLAAEWGNGRRRGWLSNIHLGARDPETGGFVMLGKTFKGMTDEMLEWQTRVFQGLAVRTEGHVVHVRPEVVVEVAFNDVQASPRYAGGMALRLARVQRYRLDKSASEVDTVDTVRALLPERPAI
jgi:DNA ligase 1